MDCRACKNGPVETGNTKGIEIMTKQATRFSKAAVLSRLDADCERLVEEHKIDRRNGTSQLLPDVFRRSPSDVLKLISRCNLEELIDRAVAYGEYISKERLACDIEGGDL